MLNLIFGTHRSYDCMAKGLGVAIAVAALIGWVLGRRF
jgi:hypothetical protein